jgi:hypothetical protein
MRAMHGKGFAGSVVTFQLITSNIHSTFMVSKRLEIMSDGFLSMHILASYTMLISILA